MKTAVLFLVFNRLDTTQKVLQEIRKAQPPRLYIASDGARLDRPGEKKLVEDIRQHILDSIDWPCTIKTLFNNSNFGCDIAVRSAITWFFKQEPEGIILEDDCLPDSSFFTFCEELLSYYRDNKSIMHISGNQFASSFTKKTSYYFFPIQHSWGWATWADRWKYFSPNLDDYDKSKIYKISTNKTSSAYAFWLDILHKIQQKEIDNWDYQWALNIIEQEGLCINPSKNLVANIGFGPNATHTFDPESPCSNLPVYNLESLVHSSHVKIDTESVEYILEQYYPVKQQTKKHLPFEKILLKIKKNLSKLKKFFYKKYNLNRA